MFRLLGWFVGAILSIFLFFFGGVIAQGYGEFLLQLVKEAAGRDGVQLVQFRYFSKERLLIPPHLKGPYPPCREWLKTAPRWVGEADETNYRYRFWMGFHDTALKGLHVMFHIDQKPLVKPVFGKSGPASDEDLKKAGLL